MMVQAENILLILLLFSDPNKSNWIPIYSYDREDEENEAKLTIKLLDKRFANQAQKNLVALLNE